MTSEPIERKALQAKWRANDAELNRIVNAPSLDRIMLAKREEALLDEQERIEFELGRDTATPFEPTKIIDQYRSVLFQLNAECTELGTLVVRETDCYEKRNGEWKLIHQHASVPSGGDWDGKITTA
jgi:hypothetical protein